MQCQPLTSPLQVEFHFVDPSVSPSSQVSVPTFNPSPQIGAHVEEVIPTLFVHENPVSICQVLEQPSPLLVFPSSHCSVVVIYPSFHCSVHVEAMEVVPPEQCHPLTSPVQVAFHLLVPSVSPSSQASLPKTFPSPQIGDQVDDVIAALLTQFQPVSVCQVLEQPSPLTALLSSHCSDAVIYPSLHNSVHTDAVVDVPPSSMPPIDFSCTGGITFCCPISIPIITCFTSYLSAISTIRCAASRGHC